MGRCYEFGVVVREGCDHAMVVPDEGGRCECSGCGALCTGRFKGCSAIISRPGHVPARAPTNGRLRAAQPDQRGRRADVELLTGDLPSSRDSHDPPSLGPAIDDARRGSMEAMARLEQLAADMTARDEVIAEAFESMNAAYTALSTQVQALVDSQCDLVAAVTQLEARLEATHDPADRSALAVLRTWRRGHDGPTRPRP